MLSCSAFEGFQKQSEQRCSWHLFRIAERRTEFDTLFCRTDTVRARVAAGLFDRIANWNGYARALYPSACGVDTSGSPADITTSVGLMSQAGLLKIPPKLFSRPGQQFEVEDLDRLALLPLLQISACHHYHGGTEYTMLQE